MLCAQPATTNKIAFRKIIKDLLKITLNILKFICLLFDSNPILLFKCSKILC